MTAGAVESGPKKLEKELAARESSGTSKAAASGSAGSGMGGGLGGGGLHHRRPTHACPAGPRSVPARKKSQAAPPLKPPPPPPPPPSDDLPWGHLTLNKCLVLASLVALLGSAVQLCRGEHCRAAPRPRRGGDRGNTPKGWGEFPHLRPGCASTAPPNFVPQHLSLVPDGR